MTSSNPIQEIQDLLAHDYIRERRKGIEKAAERLAQGLDRETLREMLSQVAKGDPSTNLAELAQQTLDDDDQRHANYPPQYTSSAEHIVGKICPHCGQTNYYDKRTICGHEVGYRAVERNGKTFSALGVACNHCKKNFKIEVDCEGYR